MRSLAHPHPEAGARDRAGLAPRAHGARLPAPSRAGSLPRHAPPLSRGGEGGGESEAPREPRPAHGRAGGQACDPCRPAHDMRVGREGRKRGWRLWVVAFQCDTPLAPLPRFAPHAPCPRPAAMPRPAGHAARTHARTPPRPFAAGPLTGPRLRAGGSPCTCTCVPLFLFSLHHFLVSLRLGSVHPFPAPVSPPSPLSYPSLLQT